MNGQLAVLEAPLADAIRDAAAEVAGGEHDDQFPIDVFQTGSGTSSNMNANEVIAALAARRLGRPVHPNDHVNASQSSNDVFPTAMHLSAVLLLCRDLLPALSRLGAALDEAVRTGLIPRQPTTPMAHILLGAVTQAGMVVSRAEDPVAAKREMSKTIQRLLKGLAL